jgi:3-oxoacyl-[acyl-carrier-protein] synthase-3
MTNKIGACISSVGGYAPPNIVTNHDLAEIIDTSHSWVVQPTGIVERRKVEPGAPVSELASFAAMNLIRQRGTESDQLDLIIVCTVTPEW